MKKAENALVVLERKAAAWKRAALHCSDNVGAFQIAITVLKEDNSLSCKTVITFLGHELKKQRTLCAGYTAQAEHAIDYLKKQGIKK